MGVYKKIFCGLGLAAAMGAWLSTAAQAAENGVLNYPAGAPAVFLGQFPPIPGLFMASQTTYSYADALYDLKGNKLAVPFKLSAESETFRFLASWPADLFGAHLLSQLVVPMVNLDLTTPLGPDSGTGLANLTISPLIMTWTKDQFHHFTLGLDIATDAASYRTISVFGNTITRPGSVGNGYSSFMPTVAYRYDNPTGFDFGIAPRLSFNTKNTTTNYQTGTALLVDLEAGYNIGKWKFGVAGGYTQQLEDDTLNGVNIGNRLKQFALGPSVTYTTMPYIFNLNWQPGLYAENGARVSSIWANFALPLSVGGGPLEGPKGMK